MKEEKDEGRLGKRKSTEPGNLEPEKSEWNLKPELC
jgi:hypothetical protein